MAAVAPLRLIQLGKESTRGTEVDATARRVTRPGGVTFRDLTEKQSIEADYGLLDKRHSSALSEIARQSSELELAGDLSFEQVLYPLLAGVKGGVGPGAEQTVGQGDFKWLFTPNATADPAPDAFTLEYVEREGTTVRQEITAVYGLCKRIRISASKGNHYATLDEEWFARKAVSKAFKSGIGLPSRTIIPAPKFTLEPGATFAALGGGTVLPTQVISFEWELETGIMPKWRLDTSSPDFAAYQFGIREMTLSMTLDLSAEAETERTTILQAAIARYWRIEVVGAQIGSGLFKTITIDGAYENVDPMASGSDEEGQSSIDLKYTGIHDSVKGAPFEITVINTLASIP